MFSKSTSAKTGLSGKTRLKWIGQFSKDIMDMNFLINFLYYVILGTVNGVVGLADLTRFGVKHQTFWTMDDAKKQGAFMNVSTNR